MGELVDRDQEHLRLLKIGYYVTAGVTGLVSLFSLIYIGLGGLFVTGAIPRGNADADPQLMGLIFLGLGLFALVLGIGATLATYLAGRAIGNRRHRTFCMVVAVFCCLQIPWGTVFGVCCLMVLSRESVRQLFQSPPQPPVAV